MKVDKHFPHVFMFLLIVCLCFYTRIISFDNFLYRRFTMYVKYMNLIGLRLCSFNCMKDNMNNRFTTFTGNGNLYMQVAFPGSLILVRT